MLSVVVIVGYLVAVTAIGSLLARRTKSSAGWAVADGRMGLLLLIAGIAGTRIGGVGTYGVAGDVMQTGLWNLWYGVNTFLALALVGLFFAVPFRRLGLQTVSEVFVERFGSKRSQVLTSLCVQTEYLIINILEPFIIGSIVSTVLDVPFAWGVAVGAVTLILYTSLGGLWGSAATNVIHCAVVLVGLLVVGWMGLADAGGWSAVRASVDSALASPAAQVSPGEWWSFVGAGWGAVLAMFFSATIHTPAASVYVNFSSAARAEKLLMPAFLGAGVVAALMPLLAGFVGLLTLARYGADAGVSSYRAITQLAVEINPLLGGVALAAILAAVISSGGPILLSSVTMLVRDWVPGSSSWSDARRLIWLRVGTVVYGGIAAFIAWWGEIGSILELLLLGFAMVVPPAVALAYVLYWRRTTEVACFWGIAAGYVSGLLWYLGIRVGEGGAWQGAVDGGSAWGRFAEWAFLDSGGVDPSYVTTLVPLFLIPALSWIDARPDAARTEAFYDRLRSPRRTS